MEASLYNDMKNRIANYVAEQMLQDKYIVIFGSNESGEKMMELLQSYGLIASIVVDNNIKKDGTYLNGLLVTTPEKALQPYRENVVVLIASRYYPEMVLQLESMGYQEGKEILKAAEYNPNSGVSLTEDEFDRRVEIVKKGQQIYEKICDGKEHDKIYIFPIAELGATYVGLSFLREYNQSQEIENFRIVVLNQVGRKIAYLFGYDAVTDIIKKDEMDCLLQYAVFTDMADGHIKILNHRYPYTRRVGEIGNYKGVHFVEMFRSGIYEMDQSVKPEAPYVNRDNEVARHYVDELFEAEQLVKGKTVILMPYANTATLLPESYWTDIAKQYQEKGYMVCTNSSSDAEPAIAGTKPLFFDIRYGLEVVEAAGVMVALRSGLCDVLSTAKAKKIIVYPYKIYNSGTFMEFYSLNRMGLCEDAEEEVIKQD